jgi:hypothetical protein
MENPLRLNNFATNIRELSRLVLHNLAPDENVMGCSWYTEERNDEGKVTITRKQRMKYAAQAGLPDDFVKDTLHINVDNTATKFNKVINKLSSLTHISEKTFDTDEDDAHELAEKVLELFEELLLIVEDVRAEMHSALESGAQELLDEEVFQSTIQELSEVATHYTVNYVHFEHFKLNSMNDKRLVFDVSGSVDCELQYGSDSDVARGDGLRSGTNFPLTCTVEADINSPLDIKVENLVVDNSSFYE